MWPGLGLLLCMIVIALALLRSVRGSTNYYASHVYGMTARTHRRYAALSALFAAIFIAAFFLDVIPAVPLLGVYALIAIFYFSSFARGFGDEE